jgi:hypothetical protein
MPALTRADRQRCSRSPSLAGRGVDDLLHVTGRDVLAGHRGDDRDGEPAAQPALGVGVPAGPPLPGRQRWDLEEAAIAAQLAAFSDVNG